MRQLLKEKDLLIANMLKLARQKEQSQALQAQTLAKELERQTYLIKAELLDQFKLLHHSALSVQDSQADTEQRFSAFKQEYLHLLDGKDHLQQLAQRLQQ